MEIHLDIDNILYEGRLLDIKNEKNDLKKLIIFFRDFDFDSERHLELSKRRLGAILECASQVASSQKYRIYNLGQFNSLIQEITKNSIDSFMLMNNSNTEIDLGILERVKETLEELESRWNSADLEIAIKYIRESISVVNKKIDHIKDEESSKQVEKKGPTCCYRLVKGFEELYPHSKMTTATAFFVAGLGLLFLGLSYLGHNSEQPVLGGILTTIGGVLIILPIANYLICKNGDIENDQCN